MKKNNKNAVKWLALINISAQMGLIIFVSFKIGSWLDTFYPSPKIVYYKLITIIGVFLALYNVYRQIQDISKDA